MVSVIIPAYNVERYIGACLDSVLAQKDVDFEIIVVDDESSDSTMKIVSDYAAGHKCIRATEACRPCATPHCSSATGSGSQWSTATISSPKEH
jgi:cellulose synthase/poly-beta-1,6-N-acetylglucosamine synthase-like glycosyltransferase